MRHTYIIYTQCTQYIHISILSHNVIICPILHTINYIKTQLTSQIPKYSLTSQIPKYSLTSQIPKYSLTSQIPK